MQPNDISAQPEVKELQAETTAIVQTASNYSVTNAAEFSDAGEQLKKIKAAKKRLDDLRMSMTRPLDAAKRAVMDFFRDPGDKLDRAESSVKRAMLGYQSEQDRLRREEQRKADEAARKEREKLEAQAAKAAASGKTEKAEAIEQRAAQVVAPVIQREPPKVAGVSFREAWKFEVTDESLVPREYLSVDEKKIRAVVNALKGGTSIAGVRVYSEKNLAAGAA